MKKILGLLFISMSMFGMELSLIKNDDSLEKIALPAIASVWQQEIKQPSVFIPVRLGNIKLYHSNKGFRVYDENGNKKKIESVFLDPVIRNVSRQELTNMLQTGYLVMNRTTNGDYSLKANVRTVGAGPLFGKIMYWVTKSACYAVLAAGAGAIVIFGGAGAVAASTSNGSGAGSRSPGELADTALQTASQGGIAYVGLEATVTQVGGEAIFAPALANAAMVGAGTAAVVIAQAGGAPVCAEVAGAALSTGTSGTGIVAGIEAISITVGVLCGMTPTP
jgi:hypothetical protein